MIPQICQTTLFQGNVQGVGFRFTTRQIAQRYAVTGYVRNLPDGRVELVAEGSQQELKLLMDSIRGNFDGNIRGEQTDTRPATGQYDKFVIKT